MRQHRIQTQRVQGSQKPGSSPIYRSILNSELVSSFSPDTVKTVYHLFSNGRKLSASKNCLGTRQYNAKTGKRGNFQWETYDQVAKRIDDFGSGLIHLLFDGDNQIPMPVGIWAKNRPEWTITDIACASQSLYTVALYETLGKDAVEYVAKHAELSVIVCSSDKIATLLQMKDQLPHLEYIISMDSIFTCDENGSNMAEKGDMIQTWAKEKGVQLFDFKEIEILGQKKPQPHHYPDPSAVSCIMYTSGTTDMPKGVMLTHTNFVAVISATTNTFKTTSDEVGLSYLPLAHCFGRVFDLTMLCCGGSLGYFSGEAALLLDDCQTLKPTFFVAVPRLLNIIYSRLAKSTIFASGWKGYMCQTAFKSKLYYLENDGTFTHSVWDKLIFNKTKEVLGGRVRVIGSGAAPLSHDTLQFLRVALCCDIREGYGATETTAASCIQRMGDTKAGRVGGPYACNEIKLVDVPEMGYFTDSFPPRGEICMRGFSVFQGYYKDPEKTAQVLDSEGWYHSGDIGTLDEERSLVVIDRKKNIFKLAQGEYIAPEKIENIYIKDPIISQIFIYGESLEHSLVSIIVPNPEELIDLAKMVLPDKQNVSVSKLCTNKKMIDTILERLYAHGREAGLNGFELPKAIYLESTPFTIENDLLTPTLKMKRHQVQQFYSTQLEEMYTTMKEFTENRNDKSKL